MINLNFKLNKTTVYAYLVVSCFILSIIFSSYIFLIFSFLFCYEIFNKVKESILISFIFSLYFIFLGFDTFKYFILMIFSIILISERFKDNPKIILSAYSNVFLIFLLYLFTLEQKVGDISNVLNFETRFWPVLSNGEEINPNMIGLLSAICAFGYYVNKKIIFMIFPLFILLISQSRSAMLFFVLASFLYSGVKLKNIFYFLMMLFPFIYFLNSSNIINRFIQDGENGRIARILYYFPYLKNNYLTGLGYGEYLVFVKNIGSLDNLFLAIILVYGIFGGVYLLSLFIIFFKNKKNEDSSLRLAIFFSFMVLGLFEGSFAFNHLTWVIFALSFNSFSIKMIK